jgi:hypothetical protein
VLLQLLIPDTKVRYLRGLTRAEVTASGGDGKQMHNKAMTRFKETYNLYQTRASEIDTYERLNSDEIQSKDGDGHEDD